MQNTRPTKRRTANSSSRLKMSNSTSKAKVTTKSMGKMDMPLLIVVLMLVALGIVMVLSASAPSALADYGNSYHYLMTQGFATILGLAIMLFLSRINYKFYQKFYKIIYLGSVAILFTVLIPRYRNGSIRRKKMDRCRFANTTFRNNKNRINHCTCGIF